MFYAICNLFMINIDWPQIIMVQSECMLSGLYLFLYQVIIILQYLDRNWYDNGIFVLKEKKNNLIILPSWAEFKLQMYVSQSDLGVYNWDKLHQILVNHEFIFCCFLASNREWYKYILIFNIGEVLEIY